MKKPGILVNEWIQAGIFGNAPAIMPEGQIVGAPLGGFSAIRVNQAMPLIGNPQTGGIAVAKTQYTPGRARIVSQAMPKQNLRVVKGNKSK